MFIMVTKISPSNILGLNNLGAAYFKPGENDRAEGIFERSISIKRNADAVSMNEEAIELSRLSRKIRRPG
jgi:hypothetical protein